MGPVPAFRHCKMRPMPLGACSTNCFFAVLGMQRCFRQPIKPARHLRTHEKRCSRALPFNPNHPAGKCPAISICASTQENIARGFPAHQEGGLKEIPSAACGIRIATSMVWGVACTRLVSAGKGNIPCRSTKPCRGTVKTWILWARMVMKSQAICSIVDSGFAD